MTNGNVATLVLKVSLFGIWKICTVWRWLCNLTVQCTHMPRWDVTPRLGQTKKNTPRPNLAPCHHCTIPARTGLGLLGLSSAKWT